jgi:DNA-binding transcriptional MerR regulator
MVLIDAATAADRLVIDPSTIRQWVRRGKIQSHGTDQRGRKLYDWDALARIEAEGHRSPHTRRSCAA